ncbi:MAG: Hsp20/alpha crystallin family protein [Christensenellaceae bacterium]|nr:Hsp20/alpha crystallin family protein [Christensenellaceae bacterium]
MSNLVQFHGQRGLRPNRSLFGSFLSPFPFFETSMQPAQMGFRVDVKDEGSSYLLEAELPGMEQEKIDLAIEQNVLSISASLDREERKEKGGYLYAERRFGRFQRDFSLEGIDEKGIKAAYKDGILRVTLPKLEGEERPGRRRIDIEQ